MNNATQFEHRTSNSRSTHVGESSRDLCDRLGRTRDSSQRQLPTDHDYATSTREYQTDQSSLKPVPTAAGSVLERRQKQRQQQKQPHRFAEVDRVTPYQVSRDLGVARKTVRVIARRYEDEELGSALYEKPRPGKPRSLNPSQNQRVIAMVCSPPPAGQARWSVRLIAEEAAKRKLAPPVGRETIRILLQNHDLKPWREKCMVRRVSASEK